MLNSESVWVKYSVIYLWKVSMMQKQIYILSSSECVSVQLLQYSFCGYFESIIYMGRCDWAAMKSIENTVIM